MTYKILLDTNTVIDIAGPGRPQHFESIQLLSDIEHQEAKAFISATTLKDVYYVVSRSIDESYARIVVQSCLELFTLLPVDATVCKLALQSSEPDFEDGIVRTCAEMEKVDFIISRDEKSFVGSPIKRLSPAEYVEQFSEWEEVDFSLEMD